MAGTKAGAQKAKATILANDPDFYSKIGAKGGAVVGFPKGFAVDDRSFLKKLFNRPTRASIAGRKGGLKSRRKKVIKE